MSSLNDFKKIDLRIGLITAAEKIVGSDKLLKLQVDLGEPEKRQIIAGLAKSYPAESLIGQKAVFVTNLEPRKIMGLESQGMILAADNNGNPVILCPEKEVSPGSPVK